MHDILHAIVDAIRTADENTKRRLHDLIDHDKQTAAAPAAEAPAAPGPDVEQRIADLEAENADLRKQLASHLQTLNPVPYSVTFQNQDPAAAPAVPQAVTDAPA